MDGVTATTTELHYVDGVTSGIQSQIDGKSKYYKAEITTSGGTLTINQSTHGISYPAVVQLYNASTGAMVLATLYKALVAITILQSTLLTILTILSLQVEHRNIF